MEIERKFLIKRIPFQLNLIDSYVVHQNYLSINPEVRIRQKINNDNTEEYYITYKSDGDLEREEKESKISKLIYDSLHVATYGEDIIKNTYVFDLDGKKLECSIIDYEQNTTFRYAEIEFNDVDEANSFIPPMFLGKETTYNKNYKMKNYYCTTRLNKKFTLFRK